MKTIGVACLQERVQPETRREQREEDARENKAEPDIRERKKKEASTPRLPTLAFVLFSLTLFHSFFRIFVKIERERERERERRRKGRKRREKRAIEGEKNQRREGKGGACSLW